MKYKITFFIHLKDEKYKDDCLVVTMKLKNIPSLGQTFHMNFFSDKIIKDLFKGKHKNSINYKFVQCALIHSANFIKEREIKITQLNYNKKEKHLDKEEIVEFKKELDFWENAYNLYGHSTADDLIVKKVHIFKNEICVDLKEEYVH